jgi:hypothetical protein
LPGVPTGPDVPFDDEFLEKYAFSPEGVDRMTIWENLHRTPSERVEVLQDLVNALGPMMREDVGDRGPVR